MTQESLFPQGTYDEMRESLVQNAIGLLHEHCDGKKVLCAFSGGKDSQCCYHLLKEAGIPFDAQYSITRFDPPELLEFIREHYPDCKFRRAYKRTLIEDIEIRGLPSRWARWCCDAKHARTRGYDIVVVGVRAQESARRARSWSAFGTKGTDDCYVCPCLDWADANVWDYLNSRGVAHCRLYDEGYKRIGCTFCPLSPGDLARNVERYPKFMSTLKIGASRFVQKMRKYGFVSKHGKQCPDWCEAENPEDEYFERWIKTGQTIVSVDECGRKKQTETDCIFAGSGFSFFDGVRAYEGDGFDSDKGGRET